MYGLSVSVDQSLCSCVLKLCMVSADTVDSDSLFQSLVSRVEKKRLLTPVDSCTLSFIE